MSKTYDLLNLLTGLCRYCEPSKPRLIKEVARRKINLLSYCVLSIILLSGHIFELKAGQAGMYVQQCCTTLYYRVLVSSIPLLSSCNYTAIHWLYWLIFNVVDSLNSVIPHFRLLDLLVSWGIVLLCSFTNLIWSFVKYKLVWWLVRERWKFAIFFLDKLKNEDVSYLQLGDFPLLLLVAVCCVTVTIG